MWAGLPTANSGQKPSKITTNDGDHHGNEGDDDDDDNKNCDCCTTLANEIKILKTTIASLQTQITALKAKIATLTGGGGCIDITSTIVRTWTVSNPATGTTGAVTFFANGTYAIVNGTYNAGGTYAGKSTGTYKVLAGGAIAFTFTGSSTVNSIAVVQCAEPGRIIHFTLGRPLDYEILSTATPE
jgi:hypothetical protein